VRAPIVVRSRNVGASRDRRAAGRGGCRILGRRAAGRRPLRSGPPPALHGHDPARGHAAYLTLPDVAHKSARGAVRGVALALPSDVTLPERVTCIGAFRAVDPLVLLGRRRALVLVLVLVLVLDDEVADLWTLAPERWIGLRRPCAPADPPTTPGR
jgi:hypothetical protein